MLADIETLLVIQDRDKKIIALQRELSNLPKLAERARLRLNSDLAAVDKIKAEKQANDVAIKNLELDVQTRQETIRKLRHQQYETKKNEEFRAINHEVERYQADVKKLEDQELELMETAEEIKARLEESEANLAKTQEIVNHEVAQLSDRKKNDEAAVADLEKEKAEHIGKVEDDSLLLHYERVLAKKADAAVVPLENGQCKGCHMKVTSATVIKAKADKEVAMCENCGRILYFSE